MEKALGAVKNPLSNAERNIPEEITDRENFVRKGRVMDRDEYRNILEFAITSEIEAKHARFAGVVRHAQANSLQACRILRTAEVRRKHDLVPAKRLVILDRNRLVVAQAPCLYSYCPFGRTPFLS